MAEEGGKEKGLEPVDGGHSLEWLAGTLGALGAVLVFVYTVVNDHLPESFWGIVIVDAIFIIFATAFVVVLNRQLAGEGRHRILRGPKSALAFAAVTFALIAGALAGRASTAGQPTAGGSGTYARHLRKEIRILQSAGRLTPTSYAGSRAAYVDNAQRLGAIYDEVVFDLRQLRVDEGDRAAHRRLVQRLAAVGEAYKNLGMVAAEHSADQSQVDAARDQLRAVMKGVRTAEEELERRGYRILFPAADRRANYLHR